MMTSSSNFLLMKRGVEKSVNILKNSCVGAYAMIEKRISMYIKGNHGEIYIKKKRRIR